MINQNCFYSVWRQNSCISRSNFEVLKGVFVNYFRPRFLFLNVILITAKTANIERDRHVIRLLCFPASSQFNVGEMTSRRNSFLLLFQAQCWLNKNH
jgi:hypothetical protein